MTHEMMRNKTKRLKILSAYERAALYDRPDFTDLERQHYFLLPQSQWQTIEPLPLSSQVYMILQLGYFKAKQQFFACHLNVMERDVAFIMQTYFPEKLTTIRLPSRNIRTRLKKKILSLLQYNESNDVSKQDLTKRAKQLARYHHDPSEIFRELLRFLNNKRITLPSHTTMQDVISHALTAEETRLHDKIERSLPQYVCRQLSSLLQVEHDFYRLTGLKHDLRNFNYRQMKAELKKHRAYDALYQFTKRFLPTLKMSRQNLAH